MLWKCPIKVSMILDQCALPRGVTWRDPARHVTCTVQRIGGPFCECCWERCACGMCTQIVFKLLPPHFFVLLSGSVLPLSVLWCCIIIMVYLLLVLKSLSFLSVQACLIWRDKSTVFYSLFSLVSKSFVLLCFTANFCLKNDFDCLVSLFYEHWKMTFFPWF